MSPSPGPALTRRRLLVLLGGGAAALVTACGQGDKAGPGSFAPAATAAPAPRSDVPPVDFSAHFARFQAADEPNGDLSKVVWPGWIERAGPEVKTLYEFQVVNGDLMKYMPCFCGCGQTSGHRSNRDCYVREVRPDGSVVFDTMAPT